MKKKKRFSLYARAFLLTLAYLLTGLALDGAMASRIAPDFYLSALSIERGALGGENIRDVPLASGVVLAGYALRDGLLSYTLERRVTYCFSGTKVYQSEHAVYLESRIFEPFPS